MRPFSKSDNVRPDHMTRVAGARNDVDAALRAGDEKKIKRAVSVSDALWRNSSPAERKKTLNASRIGRRKG